MDAIDQDDVIKYVTDTFTGLDVLQPTDGLAAGDTFFYFDPQRDLDPAHRLPFATIVTKDYSEFDNSSHLDRPGVFRLNIGVSRDTFRALISYAPGDEDEHNASYDFAALDQLMPHPVYAPQSWVCVLNPSPQTFETVKPLLADAYSRAVRQYASTHTHTD
jgi:hypothetical protein